MRPAQTPSPIQPRPIRLAYLSAALEAPSQEGAQIKSSDEFWRLADWSRSEESLAYHTETLMSWAPVELLERPIPLEDETGRIWHLCKFRYFGPVREREQLIASVRTALEGLTRWRDVPVHSL